MVIDRFSGEPHPLNCEGPKGSVDRVPTSEEVSPPGSTSRQGELLAAASFLLFQCRQGPVVGEFAFGWSTWKRTGVV